MLEHVIKLSRSLGYGGVAVWHNGHKFLASCLDRNATVCEPRCWEAHDTAPDVLADLANALDFERRHREPCKPTDHEWVNDTQGAHCSKCPATVPF